LVYEQKNKKKKKIEKMMNCVVTLTPLALIEIQPISQANACYGLATGDG